jgi:hypothetical protein
MGCSVTMMTGLMAAILNQVKPKHLIDAALTPKLGRS